MRFLASWIGALRAVRRKGSDLYIMYVVLFYYRMKLLCAASAAFKICRIFCALLLM